MKNFLAFFFLTAFFCPIASAENWENHFDDNVDSLLKELQKQDTDSGQIDILNKLAYVTKLSYPDSSKMFAEKALAIAKRSGFKIGEALSLTNVANIESNQGDYEKAILHFIGAAKIFDSLGFKRGLAIAYTNIGTNFSFKKDYDQALTYHQYALKIFTERHDTSEINYCNTEIGNIFVYQKQYGMALPYYEVCLKMAVLSNNKYTEAYALGNIGLCLTSLGKYKEGLDNYLKTLQILENGNDKIALSGLYANIGENYFKQGRFELATDYLYQGMKLAEELQHKQTVKYCYELFADLFEKKNDFQNALRYHKLYVGLKDSLFNEDNSKKITEIQVKYETEKKEKEIKLLNQQNQLKENQLQQASFQRNTSIGAILLLGVISTLAFFFFRAKKKNEKTQLEKQLVESEQKALSLQMNPHFIFNSLNSISSFISRNKTDDARLFLARFAKLMRLTLENSREQQIPLQNEIDALTCYLELEQNRFNNTFDFDIWVDASVDAEKTFIPPMILQPFVENAILHGVAGKQDKGKINLRFSIANNKLICEVEDDGIGRQKSVEIKNTAGTGHKSMALQVIEERIAILNKMEKTATRITIEDLWDEAKKPKGTLVKLNIPV